MNENTKEESLLSRILRLGSKLKPGEEIEVFVPYYKYVGPIHYGTLIARIMGFKGDKPPANNAKGDYIKLKGYIGTFRIDSIYDMGYGGGEILTLKREKVPRRDTKNLNKIVSYELIK